MTRIVYIGESDQMILMEDAADPERLAEAINAGLRLPGMPPGDLCAHVHGGWVVVSRAEPRVGSPVTAQERRVLDCLAAGMTVAQAAASLCVAPSTVRFHIHQLKKRLGAGSAQALIARAYMLGLVRPR